MAGASLLTLIDDISVLMDDVAVMSKVAVKKTADSFRVGCFLSRVDYWPQHCLNFLPL